ncbi:hypothetical protein AB0N26_20700 [Streptomyces cellulosae]
MTAEREITSPVDLCLPDGRLNPAAVGWTRRPLHRANLRGRLRAGAGGPARRAVDRRHGLDGERGVRGRPAA